MTLLKKSIASITTLCLITINLTSLSFASEDTQKQELKKAIEKSEPFVVSGNIKEEKKEGISPQQILINYLSNIEKTSIFKVKSKEDDKNDSQFIVRLQQYINNIPIYGSDLVGCVDYDGNIKSISGYIEPTSKTLKGFNYNPTLTKDDALKIAKEKLELKNELNKNEKVELYLYKSKEEYKLAYKVDVNIIGKTIYNKIVFIDANSGDIINQYENTNNIIKSEKIKAKGVFGDEREIQVIHRQGEAGFKDGYYFIDLSRGSKPIKTLDIKGQYFYQYYYQNKIPYGMDNDIKYFSTKLEKSDGKFVDANYHVGKTYDFYLNKYNRDGLDGKGSKPELLVNVNEPGNAFSSLVNGVDILVFGNENSTTYDSAGSLDVIGHEYTHSVVRHTANLDYVSQSGAINEAYGDIFGTLVEHTYKSSKNWTIGENFSKYGYLRSMKNPDIDNVDNMEICRRSHVHNDSCDNDYVHENSGIINKLAYLISEGGTQYGINVKGIGEEKMGKLFYDALTEGLYSQSDFNHLGEVLLLKAKTASEKETVENALKSVGIMKVSSNNPKVVISKMVGETRYETSIMISQKGWDTSDNVVLVNSSSIADALSATPFAKSINAPILLTPNDSLYYNIEQEIKRLKAKNIYIIGGTSVVSNNIVDELEYDGLKVNRISGIDRYETSLEIAKRLGNISNIAVVNGVDGLSDAVSIAPVAANKNMPIILTSQNENFDKINKFIKENNIQTSYVIGGQGVISNDIATKLPNYKRIGGNDRNETNALILENFYKEKNLENIFIAKDGMNKQDDLIDALSAGVLAAKKNSPIVIVGSNLNWKQKEILSSKETNEVTQVGGNGNENSFSQIIDILNK